MIRAAALLATLALPAQAQDCLQISTSFDLCLAGTTMEGAGLEQFGDGATLDLSEVTLDWIEPYAGRGTGTLAEDMAALTAFFETPPEAILRTGTFEAEDRTAVTQVYDDPDSTRRIARAIVEMEGTRILLWKGAPWDAAPDGLEAGVIEMANALHLRCPGGC